MNTAIRFCLLVVTKDVRDKDHKVEFFMTHDAPFAKAKLLAYFGFAAARLWESSEFVTRRTPELEEVQCHAELACVFVECTALQGGHDYGLAWLLSVYDDEIGNLCHGTSRPPGTSRKCVWRR